MVQESQILSEDVAVPEGVRLFVERLSGEQVVEDRKGSISWNQINRIDEALAQHPQGHFPILNIFTPGLYCRQIFMPADSLLTSKIHMTEHPYIISCGVVSVWEYETGWRTHRGPHTGITKPGTRRVLYVHEDTIWTTVHTNAANETDVEKLTDRLFYDHLSLGHMKKILPEKMEEIKRAQRGEAP